MRVIIFLDIDGTVNLMPNYIQNRNAFKVGEYDLIEFDQSTIDNLNKLYEFCTGVLKHDPKIVISSAWRTEAKLDVFKHIFDLHECKIPVIDVTPMFNYADPELPADYARNGRGREIERWLNNNIDVHEFIIFDDMTSDIVEVYRENLIGLDSSLGIDDEAYNKAIEILSN